MDQFDPAAVPTVGQLLREADRAETDADGDVKMEAGGAGKEGDAAARKVPGAYGLRGTRIPAS